MTKRDALLVLLVALIAGALLLWRFTRNTTASGTICIYLDGELYASVPAGEEQLIRVEQENGAVNEIQITEDSVYMASSTCTNQDCVQQEPLTEDNLNERALGEWIICLPNRVTVEWEVGG